MTSGNISVITCNVNGIRAAQRKGFFAWCEEQDADFICLQETKADEKIMQQEAFIIKGYHLYFSSAEKKGYSGVAIYTKHKPDDVITIHDDPIIGPEGRYIAVEYSNLRVISLYLPSGTSGEVRQDEKMKLCDRFYRDYLTNRLTDKPTIICGDWNIAHKNIDIKNWRQNQKNSGFLPEERAWLDKVFDVAKWVDAFRVVNKQPDNYTWWTYRANAREKNVGWRIDYQVVSQSIESKIKHAEITKDPVFSDHAPLKVIYDWSII